VDHFNSIFAHASHWEAIKDLPERERTLLAGAILLGSLVLASGASLLLGRWASPGDVDASGSGRAGSSAAEAARRMARVRRGLTWLVGFLGAYAAVEIAPFSGAIDGVLAGALFVGGSLIAARLTILTGAYLIGRSVAHVSERDRIERDYLPLVSKLLTVGVGLIWIIVVLRHFGQDVSSLVAALGVGSLAIGLAAQQTLGNMFAGFTLLVDRPFRPSDRIRLATGETGEVVEIGVRSTRILLGDRNLLVVPNTELANSRVINFSSPSPAMRSEVKVTIAYGADVDRALAILEGAADDPRILPPAVARVSQLGERGIELTIGFELRTHAEAAAVEDQLRRRVLSAFGDDKIAIAHTATAIAR
jgi:small-conductance mechanosensitive channel